MRRKENIWERQAGESAKAYEAFSVYRDMGLKRSNNAVCDTLKKSRQLISRWKTAYNWDERATAYDNDLEKQAHKKAIEDVAKMTKRHIRIAMKMQEKALQSLEELDYNAMDTRDIREYLKLATDMERQSRMIELNPPYKDAEQNIILNAEKVLVKMSEAMGVDPDEDLIKDNE